VRSALTQAPLQTISNLQTRFKISNGICNSAEHVLLFAFWFLLNKIIPAGRLFGATSKGTYIVGALSEDAFCE
jgi:hypothetical protein